MLHEVTTIREHCEDEVLSTPGDVEGFVARWKQKALSVKCEFDNGEWVLEIKGERVLIDSFLSSFPFPHAPVCFNITQFMPLKHWFVRFGVPYPLLQNDPPDILRGTNRFFVSRGIQGVFSSDDRDVLVRETTLPDHFVDYRLDHDLPGEMGVSGLYQLLKRFDNQDLFGIDCRVRVGRRWCRVLRQPFGFSISETPKVETLDESLFSEAADFMIVRDDPRPEIFLIEVDATNFVCLDDVEKLDEPVITALGLTLSNIGRVS